MKAFDRIVSSRRPLCVTGFLIVIALAPSGTAKTTRSTMRALYTPRPQLPQIAYTKHLRGDGYFTLHVRPDGTVSHVDVTQSTGHKVLDDATVAAFIKWRFEPGKVKKVVIPLTYTGYYDGR
jgi:TonB family protein